jgi:glycosyltransferase involved in cell wall biosynthesis
MAAVSVIMPAFNVAPYLGASIESVQAQTAPDWELLIVDDGSTDGTAAVAEAFAAKDPRVRLLRQANAGISAARNRALRRSSGSFLALLDSDDLWDPAYLAPQLRTFATRPQIDIVTGNGRFLGGEHHGCPVRPWPDRRPRPTLATILSDETSIFIMSIMRRRVYAAIGGFDESLRTNEDYEFWIRAAVAGFRFWRNDEPLGRYRRRDGSLSSSDVRMLTGILRVYEKTRRGLAGRTAELRLLAAQVRRFERELLAAEARTALQAGDVAAAADHLTALSGHGGGVLVRLAGFLARRTPRLLSRAYRIRHPWREAS